MKQIYVTEGHYYQEQYESNGYRITEAPVKGYLVWKNNEVVKAVKTLLEAEIFTMLN